MKSQQPYDLIIAGAGPVGLFAGIRAHMAGLNVSILEKKIEPEKHSRSVGIHPPSLNLFSEIGLIDDVIAHGIQIFRGQALEYHNKPLGTLDLTTMNAPYNYLLTIPQWKTESLLENRLHELHPDALERGATITGIRNFGDCSIKSAVEVTVTSQNGTQKNLTSRLLLACDGKHSDIRKMAGISFSGKPYPYRYAMGDFTDNTEYGSQATIFLTREGLVECFPIPGGIRRWVAQQTRGRDIIDIPSLVHTIGKRCGTGPDKNECRMFSEFGVERYLADTFWSGRVVLSGDAAHVVSPIGGQGMNLGWLNVADAVEEIRKYLRGEITRSDAAQNYTLTAHKRAKQIIRRAEFNMMLGNRNPIPGLRNKIVQILLQSPLQEWLKRRFTMQDLKKPGYPKIPGLCK